MRVVTLALALLLAVPVGAAASNAASGWRAARLITSADAGPAKRFEAFDTASLVLADVDGDGRQEVVTQNDNNHVYVLDAARGRILAELTTTHPGNDSWGARDINPVSVGRLEPGGPICLVVPNGAGYVSAWCYQGKDLVTGRLRFQERWEIDASPWLYEKGYAAAHPWVDTTQRPGLDGDAFLADVTGDGRPEVFLETDGPAGQLSFGPDGKYRWSTSMWDGNAGAVVADLKADGRKEAVFASDAGVISVYDAKAGKLLWTFDARQHGAAPGSIPVPPLAADITGDGKPEIVFAARDAHDAANVMNDHATWFALAGDGKLLWATSAPWMNPLSYDHPAALDVNGDGVKDVVALDWNTIGHKPGNWETTGRPSNLFALDGRTGKPIWHVPVDVDWSNKDFVVLGHDIILDERRDGVEGLGVRSLAGGGPTGFFPLPAGWSAMRGPVAGDVDGDGLVDLVVPLARPDAAPNYRTLDVGHREGALLVVATGSRAPLAWSADILGNDVACCGARTLSWTQRLVPGIAVAPVLAAVALLSLARRRR
ncbi:MAG: hypothetical protein QOE90_2331 [Thermoplasmata archaeon]|jgi:outer membrane protein assembly factor BamB|nr:hypothetical protein [Thermoplasmata archaeon]